MVSWWKKIGDLTSPACPTWGKNTASDGKLGGAWGRGYIVLIHWNISKTVTVTAVFFPAGDCSVFGIIYNMQSKLDSGQVLGLGLRNRILTFKPLQLMHEYVLTCFIHNTSYVSLAKNNRESLLTAPAWILVYSLYSYPVSVLDIGRILINPAISAHVFIATMLMA